MLTEPELDLAEAAILEAYLDLHASRHRAVGLDGFFPQPIAAADVAALYSMRELPCTAARFFELVRLLDTGFLREAYKALNKHGHRNTGRKH